MPWALLGKFISPLVCKASQQRVAPTRTILLIFDFVVNSEIGFRNECPLSGPTGYRLQSHHCLADFEVAHGLVSGFL